MKFQNLETNDEWFTPAEYITAARQIMGCIDVDPASNVVAQEIVRAKVFYTIEHDGLAQDWFGNVWINPPYSITGKFIHKLLGDIDRGDVKQAVVLAIAATSSKWWQAAASRASCTCFVNRRVACRGLDGRVGNRPAHCSTLFYFGDRTQSAKRLFGQFGVTFSSSVCEGKRNKCEACNADIAGRSQKRYCSAKCRQSGYRQRVAFSVTNSEVNA